MRTKEIIFYIVCAILVILTAILLLNMWYNFIPQSFFDKNVAILFFTIVGLALLPFADRIKIGNLFEIERLKEKIEDVELYQYLGEIIKTNNGDLLYYDSDGKHAIPDLETANFLRSNKGELQVSKSVVKKMKSSYDIDSVLKSEKIKWGGKHIFVILNKKKYWVGPSDISEIGIPGGNTDILRNVSDEEIKLIPTGK